MLFFKHSLQDEHEAGDAEASTGNDTDLAAQVQDLRSQLDRVLNKNSELLNETKKAKSKYSQLNQEIEQEREQRAKEANDYKSLYESSQAKFNELNEVHHNVIREMQEKDINVAATDLAAELAEGPNVKLLTTFLKKRLQIHEGNVKVLNEKGELTASSLDDLKQEISSSGLYDSLLSKTNASGGGAGGNGQTNSNGSAVMNITREEFDAMPYDDKRKSTYINQLREGATFKE